MFMLSDGLAEAVGVALAAARWTGGRADPTVGDALISLGYDRDFAAIDQQHGEPPAAPAPAPGWHLVRLDGPLLRLPLASGWTSAPPPRAWAPTGPSAPSCPRPGTRAASWSASAATSPSPGRRRVTAGRSPWPKRRIRPDRRARSLSGCPAERSRPRRSPAGGGGAAG